MSRIKQRAKVAIGLFAETCLPGIASEIDDNRNPARASALKRLIVYSRTHRAMVEANDEQLEKSLSTFWKGQTGDQFHSRFMDERFKLFLDQHAKIVDDLAKAIRNSGASFSRMVEIGCGDGQVLRYCSQQLPGNLSYVGLDINASAITRAKQRYGDDSRISFVHADAMSWLEDHPQPGTIILTNGGVLEYFSQASVAHLFSELARSTPCAVVLVEPLSLDHDLAMQNDSVVFGREHTFSHNYPKLLSETGIDVQVQNDFYHRPTRWFTAVAMKKSL